MGVAERLSDLGGWAAAICIPAITLLILGEIGVRAATGRSIFISEEFCGYLMANFVMLGLAHTLRAGGHIRVNLLLNRLGRRPRALLELVACLMGLGVFGGAAYYLGLLVADSFAAGEVSMNVTKTRLFIPQAGLLLGGALMALQMAAQAARQAAVLVQGRPGPGEGS
jgi:TRAP-type C4-dicarboxylate transport system permease small subunit